MNNETIITIGRQFGSGGKEIGEKLAETLGIKCYDKELLSRASKESGISQELFENHDEKPTNSFLYSLVMDTYSMGYSSATFNDMPLNHKVFLAQFNAIKKIADEGPCVIVGRCANYILEQADIDSFDVFIRANIEKRMANVSDRVDLKGDELVKFLQKRDHKRRVYYRFYTKRKWGDYHDYNMMLDSGAIGKENCINLIIKAIGEQWIIIS